MNKLITIWKIHIMRSWNNLNTLTCESFKTESIFFSATTVNAANKLLITNSPGLISISTAIPGSCDEVLSFCAPHGSRISLWYTFRFEVLFSESERNVKKIPMIKIYRLKLELRHIRKPKFSKSKGHHQCFSM